MNILTQDEIRAELRQRRLRQIDDDYLGLLILGAEFHGLTECYHLLEREEKRRDREADQYAIISELASEN